MGLLPIARGPYASGRSQVKIADIMMDSNFM
jgi:hypothetical protein